MPDEPDEGDDDSPNDAPFAVDRRSHRRVPLEASVTVRSFGADQPEGSEGLSEQAEFTVEGRGEDISVGGIYLIAEERLAAGDAVEVEFDIPELGESFDLPARVRWTRRLPDPDGKHDWAVGLEFDDLEEADEEMLDAYVLDQLME